MGGMDYSSIAQRQKLYKQGLREASEYRLPDGIRDIFVEDIASPDTHPVRREALSLWYHVVGPLHSVISFIINNRLIHEGLAEYIQDAANNELSSTPEDIYDSLCDLEPYAADELVRTIDADSATLNSLSTILENRNKEAFISTLNHNRCGLRTVSYLCSLIWRDMRYIINESPEELFLTLDVLSTTNPEGINDDGMDMIRSAEKVVEEGEKALNKEGVVCEDNYYRANYEYLQKCLLWLQGLYTDNISDFKPRERRLIESILARPEARVKAHSSVDGDGFNLPSDYFSLKNDSPYADDYFTLRYEVVMAGPNKFAELINYLSANGYIDNNLRVKQMFAYRFSAKMRPERLVPLEWHGKNNRSYELIYLIRTITDRGDYRKMRRFFFGPHWVKDRDSSYAKSANYEFKLFIKGLYPNLPDQL